MLNSNLEIPLQNNLMNFFQRMTDIRPILDAMSTGSVIRQTVGIIVQISAILLALMSLPLWGWMWSTLGEATFVAGVGVIVWQLAYPIAIYLVVKLLFLRGNDIKHLEDSDFIVTPIIATLISILGESAFLFLGVISLPTLLLTWLASFQISQFFGVPFDGGFWVGIGMFILCWITGFSTMLFTRGVREWMLAVFSIAHDVNIMRLQAAGEESQSKTEGLEQ